MSERSCSKCAHAMVIVTDKYGKEIECYHYKSTCMYDEDCPAFEPIPESQYYNVECDHCHKTVKSNKAYQIELSKMELPLNYSEAMYVCEDCFKNIKQTIRKSVFGDNND